MRTHRYAVGQHVSYSEAYPPNDVWRDNYQIVFLLPAGDREPQYQIRTDDQPYDLVAWEPQLHGEFGRRAMRLSKHAMQTAMAVASPNRRTHENRNAPQKPSLHQDLTRWDDEGGAPRSGHRYSEPPQPQPEVETALYYFNIRAESSFMEDPEGNRYPDLQAARDAAIAMARDVIAEGDRQGEDRRGWYVEVTNRANQQVLTVAFSEVLGATAAG